MIYKLSDIGRNITYAEWRKFGGCGLPKSTLAYKKLGPIAHWDMNKLTLGEIENACPYTGRSFARFAVEHLDRPSMGVPYHHEKTQ